MAQALKYLNILLKIRRINYMCQTSRNGRKGIIMYHVLRMPTHSGASLHSLSNSEMSHISVKDCESLTHRDVACLFRTPEHK